MLPSYSHGCWIQVSYFLIHGAFSLRDSFVFQIEQDYPEFNQNYLETSDLKKKKEKKKVQNHKNKNLSEKNEISKIAKKAGHRISYTGNRNKGDKNEHFK